MFFPLLCIFVNMMYTATAPFFLIDGVVAFPSRAHLGNLVFVVTFMYLSHFRSRCPSILPTSSPVSLSCCMYVVEFSLLFSSVDTGWGGLQAERLVS